MTYQAIRIKEGSKASLQNFSNVSTFISRCDNRSISRD